MKFSSEKSTAIQFQLAPMIDVVFLLLCFFMTTTLYSQWETEVDITL
ncbi:MAG: ExbD/TolR family protein, partial [Kiritimatiellia bacterium]